MGAPASGKSSMLKGVDTSKYVKVDPDAIKEKLPEYIKATSDEKNTYRGAAAMAHEESSHIAKQVMKEAVERGHHIIVDGTGADKGKFLAKMEALKAAGYHVHVAMPHLDVAKGMARMADRAEKNGRYVPDDFVRKAYQDIPKNFTEIAKRADSAALFDASPTVAQGGARLVYEKHSGGHETHHDKTYVKAFRALHG
jgi:predicted ABC-type ATPase